MNEEERNEGHGIEENTAEKDRTSEVKKIRRERRKT